VAGDTGARVARLRAAIDLARLPESSRPEDWRGILDQARSAMPGSYVGDETAIADDLLAR
jgi:hypothetical protein